jgi:GAF domain-containing protein
LPTPIPVTKPSRVPCSAPTASTRAGPTAQVYRTGAPELIAELDRDVLEDIVVGDPEYLDLLRGMGSSSYMCVPLRLGGHTLGAMGLISARSAATEPKT